VFDGATRSDLTTQNTGCLTPDVRLAYRTRVLYTGGVVAQLAAVTTVRSLAPARDRCLPVDEVFASMLPDAGLQRGWVVGCSGVAAWSLALGVISRAVGTGSWAAFVGTPAVGLEAAGELGVALARVVLVDADGSSSVWAERVAAAADGFELIVTCPPVGAERVARRVRQRLQARGVVLLAVSPSTPSLACDVELASTAAMWAGIGQGSGYLMARRVAVAITGRRVPRRRECELLLPCPNGRMRLLARDDEAGDEDELERARTA
jgi:hypothetical protein